MRASRHHRFFSKAGFTLVELLVVVGILILVTGSSLLLLDRTDDHDRYEKTRANHQEITTTLFGPGVGTTLGGSLVINGYLADTGRMPASLQDLMTYPGNPIPAEWQPLFNIPDPNRPGQRITSRIHHGWRGPYLNPAGTGIKDAWGNEWHFRPPSGNPPDGLELASLGRDGMPGGAESYDKDYPPPSVDGAIPTIPRSAYYLENIPIPRRKISKDSTGDITLHLGLAYAGLNPADNFTIDHPSLVRKADGTALTVTIRGKGSSQSSSSSDDDDDDDDDDDGGSSGGTTTTTLPSGLTFNLGYARQFQLVLYNPSATGTRLVNKLYAIDPLVLSYLPRVNTTGSSVAVETSGEGNWLIP